MKPKNLREIYSAIIRGYSQAHLESTGDFQGGQIYIKHFTALEQGDIDRVFYDLVNEAKIQGVPCEKDAINAAKTRGEFKEEDDLIVRGKKETIKNLTQIKKNQMLNSKKIEAQKEIDKLTKEISDHIYQTKRIIGYTAEDYASDKLDTEYILHSMYVDPNLEHIFFDEEKRDDLGDYELRRIKEFYDSNMERININTIKHIAIAEFAKTLFGLTENAYEFYGKPICNLTQYQADLACYGFFFRRIFENEHNIPEQYLDDPDEIIDWMQLKQNSKKLLDAQEEGKSSISLMDATDQDLVDLGLESANNKLFEAAKNNKGYLDKEDLRKFL